MSKNQTTRLGLSAAIAFAVLVVLFWSQGVADEHAVPKGNHYKCYQILDWAEDRNLQVELTDQFGKSKAQVLRPYALCNPVDKNGEGIVDKDNHLVCYQINDDPVGDIERVKEVQVQNQFGRNTLWVGVPSRELCLPSKKQEVPQG